VRNQYYTWLRTWVFIAMKISESQMGHFIETMIRDHHWHIQFCHPDKSTMAKHSTNLGNAPWAGYRSFSSKPWRKVRRFCQRTNELLPLGLTCHCTFPSQGPTCVYSSSFIICSDPNDRYHRPLHPVGPDRTLPPLMLSVLCQYTLYSPMALQPRKPWPVFLSLWKLQILRNFFHSSLSV